MTVDFGKLPKVFIDEEYVEGVESEDSLQLRLPSGNMTVYEDEDIEYLSNIHNEDDLVALVLKYILSTVSEAVRTIERIPRRSHLVRSLKFQRASHLCSAHHARWDILQLVITPYPL